MNSRILILPASLNRVDFIRVCGCKVEPVCATQSCWEAFFRRVAVLLETLKEVDS